MKTYRFIFSEGTVEAEGYDAADALINYIRDNGESLEDFPGLVDYEVIETSDEFDEGFDGG